MSYIGDFRLGATIYHKFTAIDATGLPFTIGGVLAVEVYPNGSLTQVTGGITVTEDFDGVTGLHHIEIAATGGNGYATATDYSVVISVGTVDGVSAVGYKVFSFSIENRSALMPATAGRTLAVESDGMAHADLKEWLGSAPNALVSSDVPARVKDAYEDGAVWIDTVNGAAGTTAYVNGTQHNPVSSIADATTLAVALGLRRFRIGLNSSITLAQGYTGYAFWGRTWTLALGGQACPNCYFEGALASGVVTGGSIRFRDCFFTTVTLPGAVEVTDSLFLGGTVTLGTGTYYLGGCKGGNPADTTPQVFDFGAAVGSTDLVVQHYSGGIEVRNMGQSGTDTLSLNGRGRLIMDSTNTGGTVRIRGSFNVDNSGAATVTDDANFERDVVVAAAKAMVVEAQGEITLGQAMSILLSVLAGVTADSGATLKTPDGAATRVAATIDGSQNRTAITLTPST